LHTWNETRNKTRPGFAHTCGNGAWHKTTPGFAHTCGNGTWHKTTPGFAHLWEWGLAQDNIWICTPVGMGPGTKIASGFAHLDWDLEQVKYLDLHT